MRVTKANVRRVCAVCERTLLQGEVALRFSPDGLEFVDVCPLCQDLALDYGWVREGGPVSPALSSTRARRKRTRWSQILGVSNGAEPQPVVPEPVLRRLTDSEAALVEAADLFNASLFRRTIEGVAKALGAPLVSIIPLSGVNSELVLTFAWEITWYQWEVAASGRGHEVRESGKGETIDQLRTPDRAWNLMAAADGTLEEKTASATPVEEA